MSERLAQVTVIRKDIDKWEDLQPGQMSPVKDSVKPDLWMVCCPLCGCLGELRNHSVTEHENGTVTVSPSLVCNGSIYNAPDPNVSQSTPQVPVYRPCGAHYFIERNQIRWA